MDVPIPGKNARRTVFAALHLRTGRLLCLDQPRKRAEECQEFLDFIRWHYREGSISLLPDENSAHTSPDSQSLAEDLEIQLLWLPKRSSHLHPMDRLWGKGKDVACAKAQQSSIDVQVDHFIEYLQTLSPTEGLRKTGLLCQTY